MSGTRERRYSSPPLRLWPGVTAAILLVLARFGLKAVIPGFEGFKNAMMATFALTAICLLWWLFFSRAAWRDRLGGLVLLAGAMALTTQLTHESMGPQWLFAYGVPLLAVVFVAAVALTQRWPIAKRRVAVALAILVGSGFWLLLRNEGIDGDHDASFAWRFEETIEDQLLAEVPAPAQATPASYEAPTPSQEGLTALEATGLAPKSPAWPGFRGLNRAGHAPGLRIASNWSEAPPEELWRRPVGPGWSSVVVRDELIYTQEQRGDEEIVSCYLLSSGEPIWLHRDPVRFFEANAGAGPRSTPALGGDRLFTLGATGIVNALDAGDGSAIWSRDLIADSDREIPEWGFSGSPLFFSDPGAGDRVFVPAAGQLVAYDAATGEKLWIGESSGGYSSPHLFYAEGVPQIILLNGIGAIAHAPGDGRELWRYELGGFPMTQPATITDSELIFSAQESTGTSRLSIRREGESWQAEELWSSLGLKPYFNDFVVHEGHAYGFDGRILAAIDLDTGKRSWKGGRYGSGQLILLPESDMLLVLSEKGEIALVRASSGAFEEVARLPAISGKTWNHPTLAGDLLIVRNAEEMAAFKLPRAG